MVIIEAKGIEAILSDGVWVSSDALFSSILNDLSEDLLDASMYYPDMEFSIAMEIINLLGGKLILHKKDRNMETDDGRIH